jgi:hypothetical protein
MMGNNNVIRGSFFSFYLETCSHNNNHNDDGTMKHSMSRSSRTVSLLNTLFSNYETIRINTKNIIIFLTVHL